MHLDSFRSYLILTNVNLPDLKPLDNEKSLKERIAKLESLNSKLADENTVLKATAMAAGGKRHCTAQS